MSAPQVNGEVPVDSKPNSAFLKHLLAYPVISDGVHTFETNQYGQRSIKLGSSAYQTFAAPVVPYFSKPYQYVSPYVQRADTLGDQTLEKLDQRFPVVKKPTADVYQDALNLVLLPYQKAYEGREHVFQVFSTECSKNGGDSMVGRSKAAVSTALVVSNETLGWLSSFLRAKKADAAQAVNEKVAQ